MASISSVKICNMGLSHIGAKATIESLTEASPTAKACNLWYDWSRIQTLEDHDWNFARVRKVLALTEEEPYDDWLYRYEYPSNCVNARWIVPVSTDDDAVPFEVGVTDDGETKCILTNMPDATLVYTFDLSNPALFSSRFVDALSWRVAYHIAFPLTGKLDIERAAMQVYGQIIAGATASNANEGRGRTPRDAESIRARL